LLWPIVVALGIAKIGLLTGVAEFDRAFGWWLTGLIFMACLQSREQSGQEKILWRGIILPLVFSGVLLLSVLQILHKFAQEPSARLFFLFCHHIVGFPVGHNLLGDVLSLRAGALADGLPILGLLEGNVLGHSDGNFDSVRPTDHRNPSPCESVWHN
jgi:hypothetical protein